MKIIKLKRKAVENQKRVNRNIEAFLKNLVKENNKRRRKYCNV